MTELKCTAVTHAHIRRILHPRLGVEVDGRSCVRYLRFRRRVRIDHLELPRNVWTGRWEPVVPIHPAHITVSVLDGARWRVVKDVEFPRIPLIAGDGVDPETPAEEMTERFKPLMDERLRIDLGGLETDHLRVECDREHPVFSSHTDMATGSQLELFCNGAVVPATTEYYIRALAANGLKANARKLARDMEEGYLSDAMSPGTSEGAEFFSWDGLASGYEGTFGPNFLTMYALAIQRGLFTPPDPEWWPEEEG